MLQLGSFFLLAAVLRSKVDGRMNTKLTRRLFVTKALPLPLVPRPFLHNPVISWAVLHLAQVNAVPPDVLPWGVSGRTEGMGEQTPEAFAGGAGRQVTATPSRGWIKVGFTIRRE